MVKIISPSPPFVEVVFFPLMSEVEEYITDKFA